MFTRYTVHWSLQICFKSSMYEPNLYYRKICILFQYHGFNNINFFKKNNYLFPKKLSPLEYAVMSHERMYFTKNIFDARHYDNDKANICHVEKIKKLKNIILATLSILPSSGCVSNYCAMFGCNSSQATWKLDFNPSWGSCLG